MAGKMRTPLRSGSTRLPAVKGIPRADSKSRRKRSLSSGSGGSLQRSELSRTSCIQPFAARRRKHLPQDRSFRAPPRSPERCAAMRSDTSGLPRGALLLHLRRLILGSHVLFLFGRRKLRGEAQQVEPELTGPAVRVVEVLV